MVDSLYQLQSADTTRVPPPTLINANKVKFHQQQVQIPTLGRLVGLWRPAVIVHSLTGMVSLQFTKNNCSQSIDS